MPRNPSHPDAFPLRPKRGRDVLAAGAAAELGEVSALRQVAGRCRLAIITANHGPALESPWPSQSSASEADLALCGHRW